MKPESQRDKDTPRNNYGDIDRIKRSHKIKYWHVLLFVAGTYYAGASTNELGWTWIGFTISIAALTLFCVEYKWTIRKGKRRIMAILPMLALLALSGFLTSDIMSKDEERGQMIPPPADVVVESIECDFVPPNDSSISIAWDVSLRNTGHQPAKDVSVFYLTVFANRRKYDEVMPDDLFRRFTTTFPLIPEQESASFREIQVHPDADDLPSFEEIVATKQMFLHIIGYVTWDSDTSNFCYRFEPDSWSLVPCGLRNKIWDYEDRTFNLRPDNKVVLNLPRPARTVTKKSPK